MKLFTWSFLSNFANRGKIWFVGFISPYTDLNKCSEIGSETSGREHILLPSDDDLKMKAYCGSNWGGCHITRRSVGDYCILLGNSLVSRKSKKQTNVLRSSTDEEYRAMENACLELTWLCYILRDRKVPISLPTPLNCDNKATLHIAANSIFHERMKHIEIDCHIIREKLQGPSPVSSH